MDKVLFSSRREDWCTPQWLFDQLDAEFHFTLDPCCTDKSAKCEQHYTLETDGLKQNWGGQSVFCNPPYGGKIREWCRKSWDETRKPNTTVVMLIPCRTDTVHFHEYIIGKADEVRFFRGRLKYTDEDGNEKDTSPFPSCIVVWRSPDQKKEDTGCLYTSIRNKMSKI